MPAQTPRNFFCSWSSFNVFLLSMLLSPVRAFRIQNGLESLYALRHAVGNLEQLFELSRFVFGKTAGFFAPVFIVQHEPHYRNTHEEQTGHTSNNGGHGLFLFHTG